MIQVEANSCGKPVIGIKAMGLLDTMIHGKTAFLAGIAQEIRVGDTLVGEESGYEKMHKHIFNEPRIVDYRASVNDIAKNLFALMSDDELRKNMGEAGRKHVIENFEYRLVARKFIDIVSERLGLF